jgi:hypothetical protein
MLSATGGCTSSRAIPDARTELAAAIAAIRGHDLYAANVDWSTAIPQANAVLASAAATAPSAAYLPISDLLVGLGDKHAQLLHPGVPTAPGFDPTGPLPSVKVAGSTAILTLPGWVGPVSSSQPYARAAWRAVAATSPACGWVLDLTGNEGGDLWPMLAATEPFLTLGQPIGATTAGQPPKMFTVDAGTVTDNNDHQAYGTPPPRVHGPVAVLIGPRTESSGEWLALALQSNPAVRTFGAPTAGVPTSPVWYALPDGAHLELSVSAATDIHGHEYTTALQPERATPIPLADAEQWLIAQCSTP